MRRPTRAALAALEAPLADEQDRRVEPRGAIAGSGMLTDPERIEALQAEAARRERAWRERPKKGFASVLDEVEHPPAEEEPAPRHGRGGPHHPSADGDVNSDAEDVSTASPDEEAAMERAAAAVPAVSGLAASPPPAVRRAPPDPRMAALHQLVDQRMAPARSSSGAGEGAPSAPGTGPKRRSKKGRGA